MVKPRAIIVAFAASAALSLALASTVAIGQGEDSDHDGVPDSLEMATARLVVVATTADEMNITSGLGSDRVEDHFEISYKAGTFDVSYDETAGSSSSYELELKNIVEWRDANNNSHLDDGEIVGWTPLGSSAFGNVPILHTNSTDADGGRIFQITIRSNTGEVTLNLTIAQRFMRLPNGRTLTPMEVKLDVSLNHLLVSGGASLGLEFRLDTAESVGYGDRSWDDVHGFAQGDAGVNVTGGPVGRPATVFFSWAKTAMADGVPTPVSLSSVGGSEPGSYELYLAYPVDNPPPRIKILHDPTLGVESAAYADIVGREPPLRADVLLYAGSLAIMAFVVVATIVLANRRRRKGESGGNP